MKWILVSIFFFSFSIHNIYGLFNIFAFFSLSFIKQAQFWYYFDLLQAKPLAFFNRHG